MPPPPFLILFLLLIVTSPTSSQPSSPDDADANVNDANSSRGQVPPAATQSSFRPSIAIVVGIFSIMFSVTFLLLMYAKFCHSAAYDLFNRDPAVTGPLHGGGGLFSAPNLHQQLRSSSGIDKSVIDSLPFFRFSALKGSRSGLECAVCISKFDDADVLRLLPKCKHAFHLDCVDRWLESHSTCPLCRHRIDPHDATLFHYSNSTRSLFKDTAAAAATSAMADDDDEELQLEIYVEREKNAADRSNNYNDHEDEELAVMHKFRHRILVSDVVFKSRWSDINSADLVSLNCDMLGVMSSSSSSSRRGGGGGGGGGGLVVGDAKRCMSEITSTKFARLERSTEEEDRVRKTWLPMAKRTVQWFGAGRKTHHYNNNNNNTNV